jgi:hypothetical protein
VSVFAASIVTMLAAAPAPANAAVSNVTLYDAVNYGGNARTLYSDDSAIGLSDGLNGELQGLSIRIPPGQKVAIFGDTDFAYFCETLTADDPNTNVGNAIASQFPLSPIKSILLNTECPITVYTAGNYGGSKVSLGRVNNMSNVKASLALTSIWDDAVSSVHVAPGRKVTVYDLAKRGGVCDVLSGDDPDLRDNRIGNDSISSISLESVCPMKLYPYANYGGNGTETIVNSPDIGGILGTWNDIASSVRITPGQGQKLSLYQDDNYGGVCETFTADDPDFSDNRIGDNSVSSYRVNEWCRVTLFENDGFGGRSLIVADSIPDLRDTRYNFNDLTSSIRVQGGVVAAWSDINFTGTCDTFTADDDHLGDNRIGNDRISSLQLGVGCPASA